MLKIRFIRHAHSEANEKMVISGDPTVLYHLSKKGVEQANQLNLEPSDWLVASDFTRAIETAQLLFPHQEISISPLFRELSYGPYEALDIESNIEEYRVHFFNDEEIEGLETYSSSLERAKRGYQWLIDESKKRGHKSVTVISHAGFMRVLNAYYFGLEKSEACELHFKNTQGFEVEISD